MAQVKEINDDDTIADKFSQELTINRVNLKDQGNYTCIDTEDGMQKHFFLQPIIPPKIVAKSNTRIRTNMNKDVTLFCLVEAFPLEEYKSSIEWRKEDVEGMDFAEVKEINLNLSNKTRIKQINETRMNVTLNFESVSKKHNGTYICRILIPRTGAEITGESSIFVLDRPEVRVDFVKAVGANKIFMNWTVNDGNDPVQQFYIQYRKEGDETFTYYKDRINGKNQSCVLENFDPSTNYQFRISAQNKIAMGPVYIHPLWVKTLEKDPVFIPSIEVKGNTHSTITIGWTPPPPDLLEYIQYYDLVVVNAENASEVKEAIHLQNSRNLPYMFDGLRTAAEYNFRVRACSELTKACGNWSESVTGTTMDGISSEPINLKISCTHYNITRKNSVEVTWEPPVKKNGKIISYHVVLSGVATFRSDQTLKNETFGPKTKSIDEKSFRKATYEGIPPNTNYTVQVQAVTRSKKPGDPATLSCVMPPTVPDVIGKFLWGKVKTETNEWVFKLNLPRISERNGPICCYRIYMVRVAKDEIIRNLPLPEDLDVMTYHEVHANNNTKGGAYIAEVMTDRNFHSEIFLGDGKRMNGNVTEEEETEACRKCLEGAIWRSPAKKRTTTTTTTTTTSTPKPILPEDIPTFQPVAESATEEVPTTVQVANRRRRRRQHFDELLNAMLEDKTTTEGPQTNEATLFSVFDGQLDLKSEYTGFVEVIVKNRQGDKDQVLSSYSEYFQMMQAGAPPNIDDNNDNMTYILALVVQILLALIVIVLFLLMTLCIVHRYYTKNVARGEEAISLRESLRALCGGRTQSNHHRHLIGTPSSKPPDIPPIPKSDMTQAYVSRHKDSDYGFQHEFEMLPDRFSDRTTKNSDAKENSGKNRYPDIKAYDQTRVKLSTVNSIIGSDYINANFVLGYKERKKFICAQGPMDGTVNDFWRMIWEQHLEIIVMLTNLEEYNKTKCAKYWPEKVNDSTQFGDISVTFVTEERFSDYLVRELKVVKRSNGYGDEEEDRRYITQYHYLMWKDFMAPEHPQGIIKFIKQINAVYSLQRGPILVHCSAGVGRTGTLVALDSLTQQLDEEGHVAIFNTVCDMRHQRNFLVQSLKQYIFLYRALMEIAQFGSTELPCKGLGAAVETLKSRQDSKEQCQLELEFSKIKAAVDDTKKTCVVASGDENRCKNRSDSVLPFDRNRVILTPIPGRDHSTYINASFIEGYDNAESFIIAQDPLEGTIGDFWRMVSEQSINTLVMLSEVSPCRSND